MNSMGMLLIDTITWADRPSTKNGNRAMATIPKPNPMALWIKPAKKAIAARIASRVKSISTTQVTPHPVFLFQTAQRLLQVGTEAIIKVLAIRVQS